MLMPCSTLSPSQPRFATLITAALSAILLSLVLFNPRFAYGTDVDSILPEAHGNEKLSPELDFLDLGIPNQPVGNVDGAALIRNFDISPRASPGIFALANNAPRDKNIDLGETQQWVFPKETVNGPKSPSTSGLPGEENEGKKEGRSEEVERREGGLSRRSTTVYITANTCLQPDLNATQDAKDSGPPQLRMYIAKSPSVERPGPETDDSNVTVIEFDGGYVSTSLDADDDVFIGITALNNTRYGGAYNYEIAASVDEPFHEINSSTPFLYFVDGDSGAALLQTDDTTDTDPDDEVYKQWMKMDPPPFTMFAHNINDSSIMGLHKSFCGLEKNAQITKDSQNVQAGMTNRGIDHKPKEQFYVKSLNHSSSYYGFLAMEGKGSNGSGDGTIGRGKKIWKPMNFTTKSDNNCAVVYDLDFCSEVAYAVPSNPSLNVTQLVKLYDDHAASLYSNFSKTLQLVPCNATATEKYSLAKDCTNCAAAYKQWLCAVTIPRCQDFSSKLSFLQPRNIGQDFIDDKKLPDDYEGRQSVLTNSSRNPLIDTEIKPGPYNEVLPCQDLCYDLVKSCPASFGFGCPVGQWLNSSYGARSEDGDITCSYLGAAYFLNSAWKMGDGTGTIFVSFMIFWSILWSVIL